MDLICKKCCSWTTGMKEGDPCPCGGVIEVDPPFSEKVDVLPEKFTCPRRIEQGHHLDCGPFPLSGSGLDFWQRHKSNGDRVCNYCGSLHPEDMFRLVKLSAEASSDAEYRSVVEVEPSDKGYKIYVHQPGVRNAHEGGIKFYTQHLRNAEGVFTVSQERQDEFAEAVRRSRRRFNAMMERNYPRAKGTAE